MKKYKLLKDLPTFKAGQMFELRESGLWLINEDGFLVVKAYSKPTLDKFPKILEEWFEEIEINDKLWEPKIHELYYYISGSGNVCSDMNTESSIDHDFITIGDCFKTREEAEKAVEKLKALKRLRDKGFAFEHWSFLYNEQDNFKDIVRISATIDYDAILDQSALEDLDLLFLRRKNERN